MSAPSPFQLQAVMSIAQAAASRLQADGVLDEDGAALFAECPDAETMLVRVLRAMDEAASNADAVNARITDLDVRWKRFKRQRDELRDTLAAMLEALSMSKFKCPEFTVSLNAPRPGAVVTDEAQVPDEFMRTKREPDMPKIKAALANGDYVPGVALENKPATVTVRTK